MATIARRLHRMRTHHLGSHEHHPERAALVAAAAGTAVYLTLHQEVLIHLNLLAGP